MNLIQKWTLADALSKLHADPSLFKSHVLTPDVIRVAAQELLQGVCKLNCSADRTALPMADGNISSLVLRRAMQLAALELRRAARQLELHR